MSGYGVCEICENSLRKRMGSMVVSTRIEGRKEILVEDLKFICCTVCSYKRLDPEYEDIPKKLIEFYSSLDEKEAEKTFDEGAISIEEISLEENRKRPETFFGKVAGKINSLKDSISFKAR